MPLGHIVGTQCVDVSNSVNLYWSAVPADITAGLTSYLTLPQFIADVWYLQTYANGVLSRTYLAPQIKFATCETNAQYIDASLMLAAILSLWVAAFCARALYSFFRSNNNGP